MDIGLIILFTVLVIGPVREVACEDGNLEYGITMADKVAKGVCWIAKIKNIDIYIRDKTGVDYTKCLSYINFLERFHYYQSTYSQTPEEANITLKEREKDLHRFFHPEMVYNFSKAMNTSGSCEEYFQLLHARPTLNYNYSDMLEDSEEGEYPYRAFSHCLLNKVEKFHGEETLNALVSKLKTPRTFQQAMLEIQNDHRARHGSPPLELDDELTLRAQRWADVLSNDKRNIYYMKRADPSNPDLIYKDQVTGENVGQPHGNYDLLTDEQIGETIALEWYREIAPLDSQGRPYWYESPTGSQRFAQFTQTVWKGTTHVGYTISRCPRENTKPFIFVVARYWPAGNVRVNGSLSEYLENVLRPLNQNRY